MMEEKRPKVSVILGSGGIKALGAISLFDFLKEEEIPIDLLIGCSGGAIVSTARASGMTNEEILDQFYTFLKDNPFKNTDYSTFFDLLNLPFGHYDVSKALLKENPLLVQGTKFWGDKRLEDLPIKTVLQATDFQTGEAVVLEEGLIAKAIAASGALFPIMPPVEINGRWLSDGAMTAPVPVMEAVKRDMDICIAMIFGEDFSKPNENYMDAFGRHISIIFESVMKTQIALSITMHHFEMILIYVTPKAKVGLGDYEHIPMLIECAREALEPKKQEIRDAIKNFALTH